MPPSEREDNDAVWRSQRNDAQLAGELCEPEGVQKEEKMSLKYNQEMITRAKELRKNMTPWERKLWFLFLRNYPVRFQRQKVIDSFIVDFYCHRAKLVVELDGSQHYSEQGLAYDEERTAILESFGLTVIRFANNEVDKNFEEVCEKIDLQVRNLI